MPKKSKSGELNPRFFYALKYTLKSLKSRLNAFYDMDNINILLTLKTLQNAFKCILEEGAYLCIILHIYAYGVLYKNVDFFGIFFRGGYYQNTKIQTIYEIGYM